MRFNRLPCPSQSSLAKPPSFAGVSVCSRGNQLQQDPEFTTSLGQSVAADASSENRIRILGSCQGFKLSYHNRDP